MFNFCSSWNPFENVSNDEVEGIILQAERVEQCPRKIKPKLRVESPPEPATDQIQSQQHVSGRDGNFCTKAKIRKLKEVGLGSEDLSFIRENYKSSDKMKKYLSEMNDEQKELCLRIRKAARLAANQRNLRERNEKEIEMLKRRYEKSCAGLEAERKIHQALKDRLGYVKRQKCDLLEELGDRARAEGVELPAWIQEI